MTMYSDYRDKLVCVLVHMVGVIKVAHCTKVREENSARSRSERHYNTI
jgi:hypothetical protein